MTTTSFRFLRTHQGVTSFARLVLEAVPSSSDEEARFEIRPSAPTPGSGEVLPSEEPAWFDAAQEGVELALERLAAANISTKEFRIVLRKLITSPVDTSPDAVRCAACLATYELIAPDHEPPEISQDRPWRIIV